MKTNVV